MPGLRPFSFSAGERKIMNPDFAVQHTGTGGVYVVGAITDSSQK